MGLYIGVVAGIAALVLGWGNAAAMVVGALAVASNGIALNYSAVEIRAGGGPGPLVALTSIASTVASVVAVLILIAS
jgi:hypothetical protein